MGEKYTDLESFFKARDFLGRFDKLTDNVKKATLFALIVGTYEDDRELYTEVMDEVEKEILKLKL